MSESDFLTFLVNETLRLQKSGKAELSSYDLRLKDYGLSFLKGEYIPQLQVIRFSSTKGDLDFPINWSVFSPEKSQEFTVLSEDFDKDHLFSILKSMWPQKLEMILVSHYDGFCYIVGLKPGDESHLSALMGHNQISNAA